MNRDTKFQTNGATLKNKDMLLKENKESIMNNKHPGNLRNQPRSFKNFKQSNVGRPNQQNQLNRQQANVKSQFRNSSGQRQRLNFQNSTYQLYPVQVQQKNQLQPKK
jgi:hypothetical protein